MWKANATNVSQTSERQRIGEEYFDTDEKLLKDIWILFSRKEIQNKSHQYIYFVYLFNFSASKKQQFSVKSEDIKVKQVNQCAKENI